MDSLCTCILTRARIEKIIVLTSIKFIRNIVLLVEIMSLIRRKRRRREDSTIPDICNPITDRSQEKNNTWRSSAIARFGRR